MSTSRPFHVNNVGGKAQKLGSLGVKKVEGPQV